MGPHTVPCKSCAEGEGGQGVSRPFSEMGNPLGALVLLLQIPVHILAGGLHEDQARCDVMGPCDTWHQAQGYSIVCGFLLGSLYM